MKDKYPAYIDWETFERIQVLLRDNRTDYAHLQTRGVPRDGAAMLHGVLLCGECGHKMVVRYTPKSMYVCNQLRHQLGAAVCWELVAAPVDDAVAAAFLDAVAPAEVKPGCGRAKLSVGPTRPCAGPSSSKSNGCDIGLPDGASVQPRRSRQPLGRRRVGAPLGSRLARPAQSRAGSGAAGAAA